MAKTGKKSRLSKTSKPAPGKAVAAAEAKPEEERDMTHAYAEDLKTDIYTDVNANPKAIVHSTEWRKIMNGASVDEAPGETND